MAEGVALEGVSIVVRGAINPPIISPEWLLAQGIVGKHDFDNLEVEVISREFVSFTMGWLRFNASLDSMSFSTTDPDELFRVRDAAVRTLELLSHTPIAALGINRDFHSLTNDIDQFHGIGDALVPKPFWERLVVLPGMRDVSIQAVRPDLYAGHVQIAVQPSARIPRAVFILHNDHFELTLVEAQVATRTEMTVAAEAVEASAEKNKVAVQVLRDVFEDSLERAEAIRAAVMRIGVSR